MRLVKAKPYLLLTVSLALITVLLIGVCLSASGIAYHARDALEMQARRSRLSERIVYLDAALTLATTMAARTGDPQYEHRHHDLANALEDSLRQAENLVATDEARSALRCAMAANQKIVAIENAALASALQGNRDRAWTLLEDDEYRSAEKAYAADIRHLERCWDKMASREAYRFRQVQIIQTVIGFGTVLFTVGWLGALRALKKSQEALRASQETLRVINEAALDAIILVDSQGRIRHLSTAAVSMFGYHADEIMGQKVQEVLAPPEYREQVKVGMAELIRSGKGSILGKAVEVKARRADGSEFPVEFTVAPVELHNEPCALAVIRDVTERKRASEDAERAREAIEQTNRHLEQAIERANEMATRAEIASAAKSQFLANMSHEIRTPMTAILGFAELLMEDCHDRPDAIEHLGIITRNGRHLLQVINDILDLSRIEADKFEIHSEPCQLVELVHEVTTLMRGRAEEKGLAFDVEYLSEVPQTIRTDTLRLRQILINLLGNAIKFTAAGSVRLAITCESNHTAGPRLKFDVIDTGMGMSGHMREQLFQPFFQGDSSTSRLYGGTGLGLVISRKLARLLDGDIVVESQLGKGSAFHLTIATGPLDGVPMIKNAGQFDHNRVVAVAKPPTELHARILLCEDGPDNQRLLSFLLRRAGAEVVLAENGRVGCELARSAQATGNAFDLVLMDMQMPVMDGYAAAKRLRHMGFTNPIIALTAHAMVGDREKCVEAGCDDYVTKPIDRAVFFETISRHLRAAEAVAAS
jgi:PAS domain S-box-containing protein